MNKFFCKAYYYLTTSGNWQLSKYNDKTVVLTKCNKDTFDVPMTEQLREQATSTLVLTKDCRYQFKGNFFSEYDRRVLESCNFIKQE